jgi:hypothetical protein
MLNSEIFMIQDYLLVLLILSFLPIASKAEWVSLDKNKAANTPPQVTILSDNQQGTVLKIDLTGFDVKEFLTDGKNYLIIDLLSDAASSYEGFPDFPYIVKVLTIPDQAGISVEILETDEVQIFTNILIPPAMASWCEG